MLARWDEALAEARFTPNNHWRWLGESLLLVQVGDEVGFEKLHRKWMKHCAENPTNSSTTEFSTTNRFSSTNILIWISSIGRISKEALDHMLTIATDRLEEEPSDGHLHGHIGVFYYRKGNYAQAIKYFEKAIELGGDYSTNLAWMAMGQFQLGDTAQAQSLLQRARGKQETEPDFGDNWAGLNNQIIKPLTIKEAAALIENSDQPTN